MNTPSTIQCPYCLKEHPLNTALCDCGYNFSNMNNHSLICPKCHKLSPSSALSCDCGYNFSEGSDSERNRKKSITISCILTILGFVLAMLIQAIAEGPLKSFFQSLFR